MKRLFICIVAVIIFLGCQEKDPKFKIVRVDIPHNGLSVPADIEVGPDENVIFLFPYDAESEKQLKKHNEQMLKVFKIIDGIDSNVRQDEFSAYVRECAKRAIKGENALTPKELGYYFKSKNGGIKCVN